MGKTGTRIARASSILLGLIVATVLGAFGYHNLDLTIADDLLLSIPGGTSLALATVGFWPTRPTSFVSAGSPHRPAASGPEGATTLVSFIGSFASVFAVGAIAAYSAVALAYDRFYGQLAMSPRDVSLDYKAILAGSEGFTLAVLTVAGGGVLGYSALTTIYWRWQIGSPRWRRSAQQIRSRIMRDALIVFMLLAFLAGAVATRVLLTIADQAVREVKSGNSILGFVATGTSIEVLRPYAVAVVIELDPAAAKGGTVIGDRSGRCITRLVEASGQLIVYLGQANGFGAFYVPSCDEAIFISMSSILSVLVV